MPKVSVVMPVRNGARYVRSAIESILSQSFTDLELIVVDDGSIDDTPGIVESLVAHDSRVFLIRQKASGIVAALNEGINESRGELIGRMDADDISTVQRLDFQISALDKNTNVAAVGSGCEDYDLWLRMADRHDIVNLPEPLLYYRMHNEQCTWKGHKERILSELGAQACAKLRRSGFPEPSLPDDGVISFAFLESAGVSRSTITEDLISRAFGASLAANRLGLRRAAYGAFIAAIKCDMSATRRVTMTARFLRQIIAEKFR